MTTRAEHLGWCKSRALQYVEMGNLSGAWASMISDLRKHPETADHAAISLGNMVLGGGHLNSATEMRKFIEVFN